jgi:hypothetical protein
MSCKGGSCKIDKIPGDGPISNSRRGNTIPESPVVYGPDGYSQLFSNRYAYYGKVTVYKFLH